MIHRLLSIAFVVTALAAAAFWLLGLPGVDEIPGWFYRTRPQLPSGPAFAALACAAAPLLCRRALAQARRREHAAALTTLMLVGMSVQFTLHFLVPEGLAQSCERLHAGHGEFLRVAAARRGLLLETLRDYDGLLARNEIGVFAGSKPPGTLAVYMLVDKLALWAPVTRLLAPLIEITRASRFTTMVAEPAALVLVLFPMLTFLMLAPLVWLGAELLEDIQDGYGAALLALSSPALLLIDLHLDGALFPLIGTGSIALAVHAGRTGRALPALLSGVMGMLGVYCSFGLAPCLGIGALLALVAGIRRSHGRSRGLHALLSPALFLAGAAACLALLVFVLDFRPALRFHDAMAFHEAWKSAVPTALWRKMSLVEFGLYASVPLMLAFVIEALRSVRDLVRRERVVLALYTLCMVAVMGLLAALQGTDEVARLWLFMVPLLGLAVAGGLRKRADGDPDRTLHVLAAAQAALALFIKVRQPW